MDDQRRRREEIGSAPTTPAPATQDLPATDQVAPVSGAEPEVLGHFRVKMRLGAGGMGVVYAGEDANLGRSVAIKVVRSDADHPAYRARLLREAQAMARLEHPNVVRVYHIGEDAGRLFVAMELVEGMTLTAWLRDRHTWREIVAMFQQVGQGLSAVHAAGLVHRDFKPDNVLVDHDGHARVADFGLARLDRDEGGASPMAATLTRTGAMMGTPGYMAPEQQFGGDVDARADQYSFCVALREALGGRPLDQQRWNAVPRRVRAVVTRGLSYDPEERYPSLEALLAALRSAAGGARNRGVVLAASAVLVASAAVLSFVGLSKHEPSAAQTGSAPTPVATAPADAAPAPLASPADAAPERIAAITPDAAVVAPGPRDAGLVAKARADAHTNAPAPPLPGGEGTVDLPAPENDLTKDYKALRTAAAKVGDPSHLPLVRKALANIGYDGIDLAALDRDPAGMQRALEEEIASATGVDKSVAQAKLAMVKRRRGDCDAAEQLVRDAKLRSADGDTAKLWLARSSFVFAICEVTQNNADDAYHVVMKATLAGPQDEVRFVMALISYELDRREDAHARMIAASKSSNPRVRAALKVWLDGTGLVL